MVGTHVDTVQTNGTTNNTDAAFAARLRDASSTLGFPNVVRPAVLFPAARTLNVKGQSQVTLSLRVRALLKEQPVDHGGSKGGLKSAQPRFSQAGLPSRGTLALKLAEPDSTAGVSAGDAKGDSGLMAVYAQREGGARGGLLVQVQPVRHARVVPVQCAQKAEHRSAVRV